MPLCTVLPLYIKYVGKATLKEKKCLVSVAIPCPPTLDCKKNLMCASANLFSLPRAGRGCWHLSVIQDYTQGPSGLYQWRGCMAGRLLEVWRCSRTLPKVAGKSWRQYGNYSCHSVLGLYPDTPSGCYCTHSFAMWMFFSKKMGWNCKCIPQSRRKTTVPVAYAKSLIGILSVSMIDADLPPAGA